MFVFIPLSILTILAMVAHSASALRQHKPFFARQQSDCRAECAPMQAAVAAIQSGGLAALCTQKTVTSYEECLGCEFGANIVSQDNAQLTLDALAHSCSQSGNAIEVGTITAITPTGAPAAGTNAGSDASKVPAAPSVTDGSPAGPSAGSSAGVPPTSGAVRRSEVTGMVGSIALVVSVLTSPRTLQFFSKSLKFGHARHHPKGCLCEMVLCSDEYYIFRFRERFLDVPRAGTQPFNTRHKCLHDAVEARSAAITFLFDIRASRERDVTIALFPTYSYAVTALRDSYYIFGLPPILPVPVVSVRRTRIFDWIFWHPANKTSSFRRDLTSYSSAPDYLYSSAASQFICAISGLPRVWTNYRPAR
ncbi:hypothetical protein C8J57DRAFT_1564344 [Mycena rebaudengoi]|nr:hypothetical protein C8J57DRAFT_1564344 [Mycena rebaudengoi]